MTDTNTTPNTPTPTPAPEAKSCCGRGPSGRGRGKFLLVAGVLAAGALLGTAATKAFSHGPHGRHHGGMGGGMMMGGFAGPIDAAQMDDRIERGIKHFAVEANATPEQVQKLTGIAKAAAKDMLPMREKMQSARKDAMDLMTQPAIDRAQIEKLRADQMANAEAMTKRMTQALADAGEVLTPEQRKKLAERMSERRGRWNRG